MILRSRTKTEAHMSSLMREKSVALFYLLSFDIQLNEFLCTENQGSMCKQDLKCEGRGAHYKAAGSYHQMDF